MNLVCRTAALWLLTWTALVHAEDQVAQELGRNLAATCANCHGTDGHPVPGTASAVLAGIDREQLMQTLRDFQSGARPATVMHQISRGYTEAQLELIAAYFAARK